MNLFHSISTALPTWVRADLPDFKESNVGYGLVQVPLKDYPPTLLTSRFYVSMNIGLNLPRTSLGMTLLEYRLLISAPGYEAWECFLSQLI